MYSNVMVPLDGSDLAEQALSHAEGLVRSFDGTLHLVQVTSIPQELISSLDVSMGGAPLVDSNLNLGRQLVEARQSVTRQYLDRLAGQFRENGVKTETAVLEGQAADEILKYAASRNIDCIVVTTQGLSGIRRFLLGSVTDRIIRSSEVPVVVVPVRG